MASVIGEIEQVMSVLGDTVDEDVARQALRMVENNPILAINIILDNPSRFSAPPAPLVTVVKKESGDGAPLLMTVPCGVVKEENIDVSVAPSVKQDLVDIVKKEEAVVVPPQMNIPLTVVREENIEICRESGKGPLFIVKKEDEKTTEKEPTVIQVVKEEPLFYVKEEKPCVEVRKDSTLMRFGDEYDSEEFRRDLTTTHYSPYLNPRLISCVKPVDADPRVQMVQVPDDDEDFPEEPDWFLVGRTNITGLSTCRGKRKLACNEIVHLNFPSPNMKRKLSRQWVSAKAAAATSEIVRFSTKRSGEIGRLPTEWSRCIIPLVNSSKVKVRARCVVPPLDLNLLQEIVLFVSFYIHSSIFSDDDKSSLKFSAPSQLDSTVHPLPKLFTLLKMKAFKKAEFTPEELHTRKRSLNLHDDNEDSSSMPALGKRRKGNQMYTEQSNGEQALSESSLNKLVGAAEVYDLKEAEPPSTLQCDLRPYQKQALYWMSELEKGIDTEKAAKTLHPCWEAYHIADKRASAVYVNVFTGEATTQFPSALQMARGGILADAMGLGKTVMTIALVLHKPRRDADEPDSLTDEMNDKKQGRSLEIEVNTRVRGGTLIVCPMALLGQWKDELETHSKPGTITFFVHYGGDKTNDPRIISEPDVVLTTYGVMASAHKNDDSIFHRVDWYRVVLDEAHTIKSSKCRVSQAAFNLVTHCRWCLTGTPLQNNLEDLYSLLCFLHIEPWCNWAWWHKLIQKPFENGDERGLKLVKAILRPLMLRRTKETKDKEGRPILVLPPVHIQVLECEQTEAERDFYEALFRKSKVKFDQFVAQGKVLHNYASILELLLRLRQCCNHPFLVMSRGDPDLSKVAQNFVGMTTQAYAEEVLDDIRRGGVSECPICLESASDDPVITLCMHRMCRECLLSSWHSSSGGPCPICRRQLSKRDVLVCPGQSRFWVDVEENWKESSKISNLMRCLEKLHVSGSGEKSIIFSQWTSFLDLLEIPLRRREMEFLRFDGKLSQKQREKILKEFSENTEKKILLMSLKAGGVGLNLTAASNVFLMDPWWNPAVEEQAIMRIHRIGQKRQVQVKRFVVKDTVEERMQQVQLRKQRMISGALTDEEVRTARIEELKMLFR